MREAAVVECQRREIDPFAIVADGGIEAWQVVLQEMTVEKRMTLIETKEPILKYFKFDRLPIELKTVSANFANLAAFVVDTLPVCGMRTEALKKLLEAKDCAVRAALREDQ